ncbi:MAG TPA: GntR family transcriptional regulator [Candidatus Binatia bacterium]|jgi:DNA-binding GntR family transcriptional regulator|nr:GntR family transcriptional regulator [Candidatus Binatia bacterium]
MIGRGASRAEKRFKSLTKLLIEKLREAIVGGKFSPGERLAEETLAASLHVGKVALREALRSLETEGYVTFLPNNEIAVSKLTREDVQDYYTIASVLEGLAARLAVENAQPEEIARLKELHLALKEASQKRDLVRYFDANSNFHRFIAEIARNQRLYRLIDQLRQEIQKTRILSLHLPQRLDYSMREHDQILDAFLKNNPQLAESTMVRHLNNQMETLRKALDQKS